MWHVPPPNARCSLLLLLLLHVMKEMICAKRFQEAAIGLSALPNLNCKHIKAIEGVEGSKKKSMDAKHFIRYLCILYVYMVLKTHTYHGNYVYIKGRYIDAF